MKRGDLVERKGRDAWNRDKRGIIVDVRYIHGDATYGVQWFGTTPAGARRKIQYFSKNQLKIMQEAIK